MTPFAPLTNQLATQLALVLADLAYWQETIIKIVIGLVAVLLPTGALVYMFLYKMMSFMQSRLGPMETLPHGQLQLLAEFGKFLQKEDIFPAKADRFVFAAAPFVVLISTFMLVLIVPGGPSATFIDVQTGIYFAMAVSSVSVIGILMAGVGSASKYSLLGGLRSAGQLIAYELPLVLSVVGVVIMAESLNMREIVLAQGRFGVWFIIPQIIGFFLFLVSIQAELTQPPFDMPQAESELVTGYLTEYSGIRFLLFFIAEFATAAIFSAIGATLFLGGWTIPFVDPSAEIMNWIGPLVLAAKMILIAFFIFWFRITYPRFREDQLQRLAWKFLIPLALFNIVVTAVLKVVF